MGWVGGICAGRGHEDVSCDQGVMQSPVIEHFASGSHCGEGFLLVIQRIVWTLKQSYFVMGNTAKRSYYLKCDGSFPAGVMSRPH